MADQSIPSAIVAWIQKHGWDIHHIEWHTERHRDTMLPADRQAAQMRGWHRAARQEGAPGNGFDFLLMHRAMLQILIEEFPQHRTWFLGWSSPPTDPADLEDPVPSQADPVFSADMRRALAMLTGNLFAFSDEDELGLYVETRRRPTATNPFRLSTDASAGIHNYLHNRFSDETSPIDLGKPEKNLANARFWKLHGWVDARWTAYRRSKGLSDADTAYQRTLQAEKDAMRHLGGHVHRAAVFAATAATPPLSAAVRSPHRETIALRVQRLMANTLQIRSKQDFIDYLQTAIQVEHATLPLYLTAMWSIRDDSSDAYARIRRIAFQEMLHLGIVCNVLKAIGESPAIAPPAAIIPVFPDSLPGLDLSDTVSGPISLKPLSTARVELFMRIEEPQHGPLPTAVLVAAVPRFRTIGEFYDVILAGINYLVREQGLTFTGPGQITYAIGNDNLAPLATPKAAVDQIELIKEQGEGTTKSPNAPDGQHAHYYQFRDLLRGAFPSPGGLFSFPPVEPGLDPALHSRFNQAYSRMLDRLQDAWNGDAGAIDVAVYEHMLEMKAAARDLMKDHQVGPEFRYVASPPTAIASPMPGGATAAPMMAAAAGGPPVAVPGYSRIQEILDEAVGGEYFPGHGPFWRGLTRDQFVMKKVFGRAVIAGLPDGSFDPGESNLVKALEGRAPFGADLVPAPPGAIFNRMPDGRPPVLQTKINEIRAWISAGCPDLALRSAVLIDDGGAVTMTPEDYVRFWRQLDDWALFHATPEVQNDVNEFFAVADRWLAFALDAGQEAAWTEAVGGASVISAVQHLETLQRTLILGAFGQPASLGNLLDAFERFGDDSLPDDALRPDDPRHRMNGAIMWFFWSAFADACLRAGATGSAIPVPFWRAMSRAILLGLMNDGLFRGRFAVAGFEATLEGKEKMRSHVRTLPDDAVAGELASRYRQSGM